VHCRNLFIAWLSLSAAVPSIRNGHAEEPFPFEIQRIIQQLGAPERKARRQAEERLSQLGARALVELERLPADASPAIQIAALKIRRNLEIQAAEEILAQGPHSESEPGTLTSSGFRIAASITEPSPREGTAFPLARLHLKVFAGTEIHPYFAIVDDSDLQLSIDGKSLDPFSPHAKREVDFVSNSASIVVNYIRESERSIEPIKAPAILTGTFRARVGVWLKDLIFPLSAENPETRYCGETAVTLVEVVPEAARLLITARVLFPPEVVWESHRQGLLHQSASLRLLDGSDIPFEKMELKEVQGSIHTVQYQFAIPANFQPQATFVYRAAAIYQTADIPVSTSIPRD
jgi:hypothetical protein